MEAPKSLNAHVRFNGKYYGKFAIGEVPDEDTLKVRLPSARCHSTAAAASAVPTACSALCGPFINAGCPGPCAACSETLLLGGSMQCVLLSTHGWVVPCMVPLHVFPEECMDIRESMWYGVMWGAGLGVQRGHRGASVEVYQRGVQQPALGCPASEHPFLLAEGGWVVASWVSWCVRWCRPREKISAHSARGSPGQALLQRRTGCCSAPCLHKPYEEQCRHFCPKPGLKAAWCRCAVYPQGQCHCRH